MNVVLLGVTAQALRRSWGRAAAVSAAGAIACLLLSAAAGAGFVRLHETERSLALDLEGPAVLLQVREVGQGYRGRGVTILQVPTGRDGGLAPPGMERPLRSDEAWVSPELESWMRRDGVLGRWFAGRSVHTLPVEAVGSAGELFAYLALSPDQLTTSYPNTNGSISRSRSDGGGGRYPTLGLLVFLAAPAFALLMVACRFGRASRRQRFTALRLLGVGTRSCRAVSGLETSVPAVLGAVVALMTLLVWLPEQVVLPVVHRRVFTDDARPAAVAIVGLLMAIALVTFVAGALTGGPGRRSSGRGTKRRRGACSWLVGLAYLLGSAAIVWSFPLAQPNDWRRSLAIVLVAVGLPSAVALGVRVLGRVAARPSVPAEVLVAARRLVTDPFTAARLAGLLSIGIFVVGIAQPAAQVIAQPSAGWVRAAEADGATDVAGGIATSDGSVLPRDAVPDSVPVFGLWEPGTGPPRRQDATAIVATCEQAQAALLRPLPSCSGEVQEIRHRESPSTWRRDLVMASLVGEIPAPAPSSTVWLPTFSDPVADLIIPPDHPAASAAMAWESSRVGALLMSPADEDSWEHTRADLISASPSLVLSNSFESNTVTDTTGQWIILGLLVLSAVGVLGVLLVSIDDHQRRRERWPLVAAGMSRRDGLRMQLTTSGISAISAVVFGAAPAVALTLGYLRVNHEQLESWWPFVVVTAGAMTVILATGLISAWHSWPMARPPSRRRSARSSEGDAPRVTV